MPKVARDEPPSSAESRPPGRARGGDDTPKTPAAPSRARRAAGWAFTPGRLLGFGLAPLCAAVCLWGARRLPDLGERPGYRLTADAVRFDPPPPRPVPGDLAARVLGEGPVSILEDGLAGRLAKGFRKHPWVRRVKAVRLSHPARAEVELVYRTPAAAVAVRDGLYPIDADGVVLPPADFTRAAAEALPRIAGAFAAPGPAGTAWPDGAVLGAANVCADLAAVWGESGIVAVRPLADAAGGDVRYELWTRGGSRVVWGRAPGSGHPGELTAAQKRSRLTGEVRRLLADTAPAGPRRVDLTAWDGIYHEPLRGVRVGADFGEAPR